MWYSAKNRAQSLVVRAPFDADRGAFETANQKQSNEAKQAISDQLLSDAYARRAALNADDDPRQVTRGSFSTKTLNSSEKKERPSASHPALSELLDSFFFDWFQATLPNADGKAICDVGGPDETRAIDAAFAWAVQQGLHPGRICGGHNGYRAALPFLRSPESKEVVVRLNSGSTSGVMPNVMLTGGHGACAYLAPELQKAFPDARLSRADAAVDWSQEGLWDELLDMARTLSRGNDKLGGVRVIESDQGRTFYLGSRTSTVSLRVYEKDMERAARGVISADEIDPDLVRIEWTFRPQSKSKTGMFGKSPGDMIRTSVWARDFMSRAAEIMHVTDRAERIYKENVEREVVEKTLESTVQHGAHQYSKSFARLAAVRLVELYFDGDFAEAVLTRQQVEAEAVAIFERLIQGSGAAESVLSDERLDRFLEREEWKDSYVKEAVELPSKLKNEIDVHQQRLSKIAEGHFPPETSEMSQPQPPEHPPEPISEKMNVDDALEIIRNLSC